MLVEKRFIRPIKANTNQIAYKGCITIMPMPMIIAAAGTSAVASAIGGAGAVADDVGDSHHHDPHCDDNNAAADDGREQHREDVYERANASSGPMS